MKRIMHLLPLAALAAPVALMACLPAQEHARAVRAEPAGGLSVGAVQQGIRTGMTGAQVVSTLGAPNIVTTDELRREVWIYDRMASERVYSTSAGGLGVVTFGGGAAGTGLAGGAIGPYGAYATGAQSTSQRTLTVVVKFDESGHVRDLAYHQARF